MLGGVVVEIVVTVILDADLPNHSVRRVLRHVDIAGFRAPSARQAISHAGGQGSNLAGENLRLSSAALDPRIAINLHTWQARPTTATPTATDAAAATNYHYYYHYYCYYYCHYTNYYYHYYY